MAKQVAMPGATLSAHEWTVDLAGVVAALAVDVPRAVTEANAKDIVTNPASVSSPRLTLRNVVPPSNGTFHLDGGHPMASRVYNPCDIRGVADVPLAQKCR
jgi:hypothetical protein